MSRGGGQAPAQSQAQAPVEHGLGGGAAAFVGLIMVLLLIAAIAWSCNAFEADQTAAKGQREIDRAQAYAERSAADTAAANARHERFLEILPGGFGVIGAMVLLGFGAFAVWDLRSLREREMVRILDADRREVERLRLEVERERLALQREMQERRALPPGRSVLVVEARR